MANNDLRATVDIDVAAALAALRKAKRAFSDLAKAATSAGKAMGDAQDIAAKRIIDDYRTIAVEQKKYVQTTETNNRKLRQMELNQQAKRRNDKTLTQAGVAAAAQGANDKSLESASKAELNRVRAITEERRQQVMLEDAAERKANNKVRNELALRRQIFREQQAATRAQQAAAGAVGGMRYALYDISSSARAIGMAGVGAAVGITGIAVSWEKSFAEVQRTAKVSGDEVGFLRAQFTNLVQTLPVSWDKLTEIGTLAGQLGIAKAHVADFTKTTAMFSATTDVSVEDSATAFGRLNALLPDVDSNYQGLADSILAVGTNSVATETDIINITSQLASIAGPVGYSYDQLIGLSGALASVGARPELSRGTIQRAFGKINEAVSSGGVELSKWGKASGMTADQFKKNWEDDASGTFTKFMGNINAAGSGADAVLKELGITSVRDVPLLKKLAGAADETGVSGTLLTTALKDAANATGELQRQYGVISNTSGAKLQVMFQNVLALLDKIGSSNLGSLNDVIDGLTGKIRSFTESLDEPARLFDLWELPATNAQVLGFGVALAGVVGVIALVISGLGRLAASSLALREVWSVMRGSMAAQNTMLGTMSGSVGGLAKKNQWLKGTVGGVSDSFGLASKATGAWNRASDGLVRTLGKVGPELAVMAAFAGAQYLLDLDKQSREAGSSADEMASSFLTAKDSLSLLSDVKVNHGGAFGNENLKPFITDIDNLGKGLDHIGKGGMWNDFAETAKDVFRGGGETTFANITTGLTKMDAGFEQLVGAGNVEKAKTQMENLVSSAHLTDDQLTVLIDRMPNYKRELRNALNSQGLEDTDANFRKAARGGVQEMTDALVALAGVSEDAVTNNFGGSSEAALKFMDSIDQGTDAIYDMNAAYQTTLDRVNQKGKDAWVKAGNDVSTYVDTAKVKFSDYLETMDQQLETGRQRFANLAKIALRGGQDAAAEAAKASPEIIAQIADSSNEGFDHWLKNVDAMSKEARSLVEGNIAGLTPQVVSEFKRMGGGSKEALIAEISKGDRTIEQILNDLRARQASKPVVVPMHANTAGALREAQRAIDIINNSHATLDIFARQRFAASALSGMTDANGRPINLGMWDTGGYTGDGAKMEAAGIVHRGEFVMTKEATSKLGVDNLYKLMHTAQRGYATGGIVTKSSAAYTPSYGGGGPRSRAAANGGNSGIQIVDFSAQAVQALADALNIQVVIPGAGIAKANSTNNVNAAYRRNA